MHSVQVGYEVITRKAGADALLVDLGMVLLLSKRFKFSASPLQNGWADTCGFADRDRTGESFDSPHEPPIKGMPILRAKKNGLAAVRPPISRAAKLGRCFSAVREE
jgi:hypothetical protein